MSKSESGINSRVFNVVMGSLALAILGAWFFLHPNSPWHSRNTYVVAFDEVGTLAAGNIVQVNGLAKGKVLSSVLTDSCIWVNLEVLAEVPIATDSKFKIINSGLMGERVVDVQLGGGDKVLASGDSVKGTFDMGSTRLAMMIISCLQEVEGLAHTGKDLIDTVLSPEHQARYTRIARKGSDLVDNVKGDAADWIDSVEVLSTNLQGLQQQASGLLSEIKPGTELTLDSLKILRARVLALEAPLKEIGLRAQAVKTKLEQNDNTAGLVIHNKTLHSQLGSIAQQTEALMGKIQQSGLDLNVDIF